MVAPHGWIVHFKGLNRRPWNCFQSHCTFAERDERFRDLARMTSQRMSSNHVSRWCNSTYSDCHPKSISEAPPTHNSGEHGIHTPANDRPSPDSKCLQDGRTHVVYSRFSFIWCLIGWVACMYFGDIAWILLLEWWVLGVIGSCGRNLRNSVKVTVTSILRKFLPFDRSSRRLASER